MNIKSELNKKGYCIVPNVLSESEVKYAYDLFKNWQAIIPNHSKIHDKINPHGIYKYHEAGHTRHAWFIRTRPALQNIFKSIWNCDDLIVSFDGCCYIPKELTKIDKCWTHSDQAPNSEGLQCYQAFVSLTTNSERTFVVYEGTHKIHNKYFKSRNISNTKNWNLIPEEDLNIIAKTKRILKVTAGSLVIWDSRCFHQNRYGKPNSEERVVQYVCYLPKNHSKNTDSIATKRRKYYNERRTTSHWPAPIYVNPKQPRTFGDKTLEIDYSLLARPDLNDLNSDIEKLI